MNNLRPIKYFVTDNISLENRDPRKDGAKTWAIIQDGCCMANDGTFDYEPSPSSRTEEWLNSHRFTLEEAIHLLRVFVGEMKKWSRT